MPLRVAMRSSERSVGARPGRRRRFETWRGQPRPKRTATKPSTHAGRAGRRKRRAATGPAVADLHRKNDTFPGDAFMAVAADALEVAQATIDHPIDYHGLR